MVWIKYQQDWTSVNDALPPMDEEVIVLSKYERISFGHIVDPKIAVSHDGWNIPDVAFWRPCDYTQEMLEYYGDIEPCYKRLLTKYLENRLKTLAGVDDYDGEKLVLTNLLYNLQNYRSNEVVLAKLNIMLDADKKAEKYRSRFKSISITPSEYDFAKDKIARECLNYLRKEAK